MAVPTGPLFALVVAGGTGTRMETELPKQLLPLAGSPVIVHTLNEFLGLSPELKICVVLHSSILPRWEKLVKEHFSPADQKRLSAAIGGAERTSSVYNGLQALENLAGGREAAALVAIHDAVRPFAFREMLLRAYQLADKKGNAVACVPVKSSLRQKTEKGSVAVDRSLFFHVQTPQVFRLGRILEHYRNRPHDRFTDDASLAEAAGDSIFLCEGSYENIKLTTPEDLAVAESIYRKYNP